MPKSKNPGKFIVRQLTRSLTSPAEEAGSKLMEELLNKAMESKPQLSKRKQKKIRKEASAQLSQMSVFTAPSAVAARSSVKPVTTSSSNGDVSRMKGKVLIGTLSVNAGGFYSTFIRINPANAALFPQLSTAAKLYTKYRFKRLSFIFVNPGQPTTAQGQVVAGISYDPMPLGPYSKEEIVNRTDSVKMPVWEPEMILEARSLPGGWCQLEEDFALGSRVGVDCATLLMGTEDLGSGVDISDACEVYVSYEVEMKDRRPDMNFEATTTTSSLLAFGPADGSYADATVIYPSWYSPFNAPVNFIATTFNGVANAGFYLPKGTYRAFVQFPFLTGTAAASNFTVTVTLRKNKTTPVILASKTFGSPASSALLVGTKGVAVAEFYFESLGHANPPNADDDDNCYAIGFLQNSGNVVTMYGYTSANRRSLLIQPI